MPPSSHVPAAGFSPSRCFCVLPGPPRQPSGGAALSFRTHSHPGSQPCASNPGGQAFSCADFQGLQALLDAQDYGANAPVVYTDFDFRGNALGNTWEGGL